MDQQWTRTPKFPTHYLLYNTTCSLSITPGFPARGCHFLRTLRITPCIKPQVSCRACGPHRSTHTCFHWPSAAYAQLLPPSINVSTMWLAVRSTGLAYPYGYSTLIFEQACKTNLGSQGSILDHGDGYPSPAASFYSVQQHNATLVPARAARLCN